jgi:uncharacterized protein YndB with AHSA1/START domain
VTRVSRTLAAPPTAVWRLVGDPHHQPRWWPRVTRMEGVEEARFTQVLATERSRGVRADFVVVERVADERVCWRQELVGTPFERLLDAAQTTVALAPAGEPAADGPQATDVSIELRQRLRGWSRLVPFLFRRAAKRQLGEALDGLERALVG